ncbi:FepA family TonB-dependent siderophore receptor [Psychrobacter sp. SCQQ22]|uniref:FepA family TonB-dependent siderophore receptor n=1 Tax=Psychrobacter sp. SCQQ22 TaxID=2792059 RepID=UPI0018CE367A|nr:FepA family TonB-dependent siderophore receptor [Psychrobacter sp. SCQQ22]MBH0085685.1 FepA family TonB-dependent siderophore receptor [Psychrobacter sp. SCQQ22]
MLNQSGRSDHSYLTSPKNSQRLVTGKVLLSIAVASILSSTAVAAESDEMVTQAATEQEAVPTATLDTIVVRAAREELEQAAGLSIISEEAIEKASLSNDISEIVRKMPGVNLSGSSTSGQRGNQRQIDLRGMGPNNTLILIDGRPVTSRNAVRPGRASEQDTRGDSQWVPPSAIESIEVLRGPAAARYGSGSMGGVVNIITKRPTETEFSVSGHYEAPESDLEGSSWRTNVNMSGALTDKLSSRTTLGYHDSEADDPSINAAEAQDDSIAAGTEGVENIDVRQLFEYAMDAMNTVGFEVNYSRQENRWAGDSQFQSINETLVDELEGETTNKMQRYGAAITHRGEYDNASSNSFIEYTKTVNERLGEGSAGGGEGQIVIPDDGETFEWVEATYDTLNAKSEWDMYFDRHTLTAGAEFRGEKLDNPVVSTLEFDDGFEFGDVETDPEKRDPISDAYLVGAYLEDNYEITPDWYITPGLRFDYHSEAGSNWSPSINSTWHFSPDWSVKGGVSRAFKAPSLYQLDPNYIYYTRGNGCPQYVKDEGRAGGCQVLGNSDLESETSWNKEITFTYDDGTGLSAGLTYYHNAYDNRIGAGVDRVAVDTATDRSIFLWENQGEAVIEGLEGFVKVPVTDTVSWSSNVTGILRSERKDNGEPLSLIPKFTVNTGVDWDITPRWNANADVSYYGTIEAPNVSVTTGDDLDTLSLDRDPYAIANVSTRYDLTDGITVGAGVKNLFDTGVYREGTSTNAGARTFNEPGRTYVFDVSVDF